MKNVTFKELVDVLFATKLPKGQPTFASVVQYTDPKPLQKNRVTGEKREFQVRKLSFVSLQLNSEYETNVINQLAREGKEKEAYEKGVNTMPLEYGANNIFIGLYKGEPVLQYRPNDQNKPKTFYLKDGKETKKSELSDYLPKEYSATNQGTGREIHWRKLYLRGVVQVSLLDEVYRLIPETDEQRAAEKAAREFGLID
jgi:hypothetical protein